MHTHVGIGTFDHKISNLTVSFNVFGALASATALSLLLASFTTQWRKVEHFHNLVTK